MDEKLEDLRRSLGIAAAITEFTDSLMNGVYVDIDEIQEYIEKYRGTEDVHVLVELLQIVRDFTAKTQVIDTAWSPVYGQRKRALREYQEKVKLDRTKGYPEGVFVSRRIAGEIWATFYRHSGDGIWLADNEKMTDLSKLPDDLIPMVPVDNTPESE